MTRAALLLALMASPAFAGEDALQSGLVACLTVGQEPMGVEMVLGNTWAREDDSEMGLVNFSAPDGDVFVLMADDGRFCQVESLSLPTAKAAEILTRTLPDVLPDTTPGAKDDVGCEGVATSGGTVIAVTSGGQDPVCSSDSSSAIRATFKK